MMNSSSSQVTKVSFSQGGQKTGQGGNTTKIIVAVLGVVGFFGLCCLLAVLTAGGYFYLYNQEASHPVVLINTPNNGENLDVGHTAVVQSVARDERKVIRNEFWVNDELQRVETSSLEGGISPFPMMLDWQPEVPGEYTLTFRAFNSFGKRGQASISIQAIQMEDSDGDGVPDTIDECPDLVGLAAADGCPDGDRDGISDLSDACPEVVGLPESSGCPAPSEGDMDGDGVLDSVDFCLEEPGSAFSEGCPDEDGDSLPDGTDSCPTGPGLPEHDGCPTQGDADSDGVPDEVDECPDVPGFAEHSGCHDVDGDGIRDLDDACPEEPGSPDYAGCPDSDGDGLSDHEDMCPFTPGPIENNGCPIPGGGGGEGGADSDGDGVADVFDLCPEDPGGAEHDGCPTPEDDMVESDDDIADFLPDWVVEPLFFGDVHLVTPVEFQALEFNLNEDYDMLSCYTGLAGAGMERWGPFELEGLRNWDLATFSGLLGGSNSRQILVPPSEPLEVRAECGAEVIAGEEPGGSWGTYYDLGGFIESHSDSEWDGQPISSTSIGGEGGRSFEASYRICAGSCEAFDIQAPILTLYHGMGEHMLLWYWDGDKDTIDGYKWYVNGNLISTFETDRYSNSVRWFEPPCGTRREFHMTAYRGALESPPSNTGYWTGPDCPRNLRVTFDRIITGNSWGGGRDMYDTTGSNTMGPIYGYFTTYSGFPIYTLHFNAAERLSIAGLRYCAGLRLRPNREYEIMDYIFHHSYSAPGINYFTIEADPEDDLVIGGHIMDCDGAFGDDRMFDNALPLRVSDITPGEYRISDRNITLVVRIEEISSP
ncbi:thrombospondin type 3 repeat-containing protein [Chloroflexota bacterium]